LPPLRSVANMGTAFGDPNFNDRPLPSNQRPEFDRARHPPRVCPSANRSGMTTDLDCHVVNRHHCPLIAVADSVRDRVRSVHVFSF
jgi:hypothetical protein